MSDCILRVCFSCWGLWHCINRVLTSIFLSCYIRVACRCIDGILSLCSFCVYLGLSSILLFTSQVRIILDGILLRICRLSDRILGVCFSCRGLWHCVNRVLTSIFLSRYIRVACCSIDGVFCFLRFSINFCFCSILLFASQVRIIFNRVLLSVRCLSDCILGISFSFRRLWHIIDGFGAFVLLSRYIRIRSRRIDGILSLSRFGVYFRLRSILLFASQVRVFLNRVLLSVRCLSDCILSVCFSLRCLWHGVDCLRTFVLLSRHVIVACRSIDGILGLSRFGVYLSFGCILLFAS